MTTGMERSRLRLARRSDQQLLLSDNKFRERPLSGMTDLRPRRCTVRPRSNPLRYEEAAELIDRFGNPGAVVRYIVSEMLVDPDREGEWRSLAAACHEMLAATIQ
jgi:hypothetical protein